MHLAQRIASLIESNADIETFRHAVAECDDPEQLDEVVYGSTPLCLACWHRQPDMVLALLEAGASADNKNGYYLKTPCHHAAEILGQPIIMQYLIDFRADINKKDSDGNTPLHIACSQGNSSCVEILVQNNAKLDETDHYDETPLIRACLAKNEYIIARLVTAGCDVNFDNGHSMRILVQSEKSMLQSVKLLVEYGADLSLQNYLGLACSQNNFDVVQYLLEEGADVNAQGNVLDIRALHQACIGNADYNIVKLLLDWGADVNVASLTQDTALHYACQSVDIHKVQVLLNYGAKVNVMDATRLTTLGALLTTRFDDELFSDYMRIARLLLAAGASITSEELEGLKKEIPVALSPIQTEMQIAKFLNFLEESANQPKRLIEICRLNIRQSLVSKMDDKVLRLPLPKYLKSFLLFSDVLDDYECSLSTNREV